MTCLSRDRLLEAVEGVDAPETAAHLVVCARCRDEVESLRRTLDDVRGVDVPEPSPLFWDHLTTRVREAIAAEPPQAAAWSGLRAWGRGERSWWRPAAAVAIVLVVGLAVDRVARRSNDSPESVAPSSSTGSQIAGQSAPGLDRAGLDLAAGDDWQFIVDVAAHAAGEAEGDAPAEGVIDASAGSSELALSELSADEQRALMQLLNEELTPDVSDVGTSQAARDRGDV
jgi:hypothetical protein